MKTKLIKLSDTHYIVVDDSEIKEGDYDFSKNYRTITFVNKERLEMHMIPAYKGLYFKVTHSTHPLEGVGIISLSEVEEAIYGYSVEKMAENKYPIIKGKSMWMPSAHDCNQANKQEGYLEGFNAHKELVKDKLFTVADMEKHLITILTSDDVWDAKSPTELLKKVKSSIQSLLPKTEWDCCISDGKLVLL